MATPAARRRGMLEVAQILKDRTRQEERGLKVVVTGKGGVGKTTITALLAHLITNEGVRVLAVDEDPQQNLAFSLGYPVERAASIVPLSENIEYIEEKTGARPGEGWGLFLTLNPNVTDVVERFGVHIRDGLDLLVMGSVVQAATGCLCPENALLDAVIRYVQLREKEVILLDTQAGVEHFGRALANGFSQTVVVTEPGYNALSVALHSARLAHDLGIPVCHLVVNKVRSDADLAKVRRMLPEDHPFHTIFTLPFDEGVIATEPDVTPLLGTQSEFMDGIAALTRRIEECAVSRPL